jgi:hypothetical protein
MPERRAIALDSFTPVALRVAWACWWLTPLYEPLHSTLLASPAAFADDTTWPVLDIAVGRSPDRTAE